MFKAGVVKKWIWQNKFTIKKLALKSGLSEVTLQRILSGACQPSLNSIVAIVEATKIPVQELIKKRWYKQ